MRAFIEYFWFQKGYLYNEAATKVFSKYHFMMLLIGLAVYFVLSLIGRRIKNKINYLLVIGLLLALLELLRVINFMMITNHTWLASMSFHLCSIGIYLAIIAGIIRKGWAIELLFIHATIGAPLALIIPVGIIPWFNQYSFLALQSVISHVMLIFFIIYAWQNKKIKISFKRYLIPVTGILISVVIAYSMSMYNFKTQNGGQDNFFWTRYTDPLLEPLTAIKHPYVFLILLALIFVLGFIVYILLIYLDKRRKEENVSPFT